MLKVDRPDATFRGKGLKSLAGSDWLKKKPPDFTITTTVPLGPGKADAPV